jgi:hypothetical protein
VKEASEYGMDGCAFAYLATNETARGATRSGMNEYRPAWLDAPSPWSALWRLLLRLLKRERPPASSG